MSPATWFFVLLCLGGGMILIADATPGTQVVPAALGGFLIGAALAIIARGFR